MAKRKCKMVRVCSDDIVVKRAHLREDIREAKAGIARDERELGLRGLGKVVLNQADRFVFGPAILRNDDGTSKVYPRIMLKPAGYNRPGGHDVYSDSRGRWLWVFVPKFTADGRVDVTRPWDDQSLIVMHGGQWRELGLNGETRVGFAGPGEELKATLRIRREDGEALLSWAYTLLYRVF